VNTQLFTIIPYAFAFAAVLAFPILSDRFNIKWPFLLTAYIIGVIGYIILLCTTNPVAGIIATVLVTSGLATPTPSVL
jgi:hypothetical protein